MEVAVAAVVVEVVAVVAAHEERVGEVVVKDRFGLGWRPELALDMLRHAGDVEILEFIAEEWFTAPPARLATLTAWCRERPCHLHGTSLGLASAVPVAQERLLAWKNLVHATQPAFWSEHLAFVRGGGIELGHLAAPPRTTATIAGALANIQAMKNVVGSLPLLENVATLMVPPGSVIDEPTWLCGIIENSGAGMLLDLHNWHANAVNQGWDATAALDRLPLERVVAVHLAGGRRWRGRLLDDHLHPVPEAVFDLLEGVAARVPGPLDVLIERDGAFPAFAELLDELAHARASVAAGRARRVAMAARTPALRQATAVAVASETSGDKMEEFLARLYTDATLRTAFYADPHGCARAAGLPSAVGEQLHHLDREGLILVADSLGAKRRR